MDSQGNVMSACHGVCDHARWAEKDGGEYDTSALPLLLALRSACGPLLEVRSQSSQVFIVFTVI